MKLTRWQEQKTGDTVYALRISQEDQERVELRDWDHLLFKDVEGSSSIADHMLALELLTRRIEESAKRPTTT